MTARAWRAVLAVALAVAAILATATPATAGDRPSSPWVGANPYGFAIGDSIVQQCGESFGMDWRSLGFIGWSGADSSQMRARLDGSGSDWPAWTVTEPSVEDERVWFRDAGWLAVGLGTNDARTQTPATFRANLDWILEQSRGRPVLWFDIYNPPFQAQADALNAELRAAADRWPNLKVLPWAQWAREHPAALLSDQVHISDPYGCVEGRWKLVQAAAPLIPGRGHAPVGYWYPAPAATGPVRLNGWGATYVPTLSGPLEVNVRVDWQHAGRYPVSSPTGDTYAIAASGRAFGVELPATARGHLVCLDLVDAEGEFTALGCRTA